MRLKELDRLELPASADMHVHLRQGAMMELVAHQIRRGGVDTVFVMVIIQCYYPSIPTLSYLMQPNLEPPIIAVTQALEYRSRLQAVEPKVQYLMSLYLHISLLAPPIYTSDSPVDTASSTHPQHLKSSPKQQPLALWE
jgi:dihydroorotase